MRLQSQINSVNWFVKVQGNLVPIMIFGLLGSLNIVHADHHADMSNMSDNENEAQFSSFPCSSDSQCQNETEGLGTLSFCDQTAVNKVCRCKAEVLVREIPTPILQHENLCVIPKQLDEACQNDHECRAGMKGSVCVETKSSNNNEDELQVCKCDPEHGFTFSKSSKACIRTHMSMSIPSPNRWWYVLFIVGYPVLTIIFSVTRQRIFKSFRNKILKKQKRRISGTSLESNSTDEESEVEMENFH